MQFNLHVFTILDPHICSWCVLYSSIFCSIDLNLLQMFVIMPVRLLHHLTFNLCHLFGGRGVGKPVSPFLYNQISPYLVRTDYGCQVDINNIPKFIPVGERAASHWQEIVSRMASPLQYDAWQYGEFDFKARRHMSDWQCPLGSHSRCGPSMERFAHTWSAPTMAAKWTLSVRHMSPGFEIKFSILSCIIL
jgi:hypothetical protein